MSHKRSRPWSSSIVHRPVGRRKLKAVTVSRAIGISDNSPMEAVPFSYPTPIGVCDLSELEVWALSKEKSKTESAERVRAGLKAYREAKKKRQDRTE